MKLTIGETTVWPLSFTQTQEFMESLPALRQMHLVKDTAG